MRPSLLIPFALSAAALAVPALATQDVLVVAPPEFSGDCPAGAQVKVVPTADGISKVEIAIPNFYAVATPGQAYVSRNCNANLRLQAPPGYKLAPATLTYEGKATVSSAGDADITARYYLTGTPSLVGYQTFPSGFNAPFSVTAYEPTGPQSYTSCGGVADLNFMADLTAWFEGAGGRSEVKVQRGFAQIPVEQSVPVFHCGVQVVPCH